MKGFALDENIYLTLYELSNLHLHKPLANVTIESNLEAEKNGRLFIPSQIM